MKKVLPGSLESKLHEQNFMPLNTGLAIKHVVSPTSEDFTNYILSLFKNLNNDEDLKKLGEITLFISQFLRYSTNDFNIDFHNIIEEKIELFKSLIGDNSSVKIHSDNLIENNNISLVIKTFVDLADLRLIILKTKYYQREYFQKLDDIKQNQELANCSVNWADKILNDEKIDLIINIHYINNAQIISYYGQDILVVLAHIKFNSKNLLRDKYITPLLLNYEKHYDVFLNYYEAFYVKLKCDHPIISQIITNYFNNNHKVLNINYYKFIFYEQLSLNLFCDYLNDHKVENLNSAIFYIKESTKCYLEACPINVSSTKLNFPMYKIFTYILFKLEKFFTDKEEFIKSLSEVLEHKLNILKKIIELGYKDFYYNFENNVIKINVTDEIKITNNKFKNIEKKLVEILSNKLDNSNKKSVTNKKSAKTNESSDDLIIIELKLKIIQQTLDKGKISNPSNIIDKIQHVIELYKQFNNEEKFSSIVISLEKNLLPLLSKLKNNAKIYRAYESSIDDLFDEVKDLNSKFKKIDVNCENEMSDTEVLTSNSSCEENTDNLFQKKFANSNLPRTKTFASRPSILVENKNDKLKILFVKGRNYLINNDVEQALQCFEEIIDENIQQKTMTNVIFYSNIHLFECRITLGVERSDLTILKQSLATQEWLVDNLTEFYKTRDNRSIEKFNILLGKNFESLERVFTEEEALDKIKCLKENFESIKNEYKNKCLMRC